MSEQYRRSLGGVQVEAIGAALRKKRKKVDSLKKKKKEKLLPRDEMDSLVHWT